MPSMYELDGMQAFGKVLHTTNCQGIPQDITIESGDVRITFIDCKTLKAPVQRSVTYDISKGVFHKI